PLAAAAVLDEVGAVLATSANLHGGPDPRRVDEIPEEIRSGAAVLVDAAELPGTPSTVVDLTSSEPRIVREGAVPAAEALSKARAAGASAGGRARSGSAGGGASPGCSWAQAAPCGRSRP